MGFVFVIFVVASTGSGGVGRVSDGGRLELMTPKFAVTCLLLSTQSPTKLGTLYCH